MIDDARPGIGGYEAATEIALVDPLGGECDWAKVDRYGELYPCGKPSYRRLVNGPELWDNGDYCKYHAPRALKRARAEMEADAVGY